MCEVKTEEKLLEWLEEQPPDCTVKVELLDAYVGDTYRTHVYFQTTNTRGLMHDSLCTGTNEPWAMDIMNRINEAQQEMIFDEGSGSLKEI